MGKGCIEDIINNSLPCPQGYGFKNKKCDKIEIKLGINQ